MGMILRIASSRIVGQGDIVGRSGYFSLNLSANSVMRGRLDARRTLKSLVADLRFIKWEKPMQEIIDRYDTQGSPYLLPIIRDMEVDGRKQYKKTAHLVNQKLKKLGMRLGLSIPLTTYVARHAWASIAKSKNISLSVISEAMGHDSENTTRIYLASLDTSLVDKANSLILKSL